MTIEKEIHLSEIDIRAMMVEVESGEFSCDTILEMYHVSEKGPLRDLYSYFILRAMEEFETYGNARESIKQKFKYTWGDAQIQLKEFRERRKNSINLAKDYLEVVREDLIMGAFEEERGRIKYAGFHGGVIAILDSLKMEHDQKERLRSLE